ncbi:patatin-like phospholipase family protein [Govanella unica]|uniref:Patatin-like phospholipase family protein n=1 Tax=Govanella unica TaxID=2975056 RepID=A0A9X3TXY2_9PROT|nr:patatin-like phospholipase family protein [Govania unica]MDA5193826.1 patatin-like phospholipase family protein [Govania unica]
MTPADKDALTNSLFRITRDGSKIKSQVVLVFQGGGALGAYQGGVYAALHEAGIEPDWVIGTSIGAINGAIIVGNKREDRLDRLREFWRRIERAEPLSSTHLMPWLDMSMAKFSTLSTGLPGFFDPNIYATAGIFAPVGAENASFYTTDPLRNTLKELIDFDRLNVDRIRMTLGAVSVTSGNLYYFDNHNQGLTLDHVIASCSLPPAFPAVRINGQPFWDGGVYSNSPIDAVFDDTARKDSVIFSVNLWPPEGAEPQSIWQVLNRQKDISYSSSTDNYVTRQQQTHRLRHTISELVSKLPPSELAKPEIQELANFGCPTHMHIIRLLANPLEGDDVNKDIDFCEDSITSRWQNGYADVCKVIKLAPWTQDLGACGGVIIHDVNYM